MNKPSLRMQSIRAMKEADDVKAILKIDLDDIIPDPSQPRKTFPEESIAELAENMAKHGQLAPILVRENPAGVPAFLMFDGERRWRAAKLTHSPAQLEAIVYRGDVDPDLILERQFMINDMNEEMPLPDRSAFYATRVEKYGSVEAAATHLRINPKRMYKVLQAGKLDGAAGEARDQKLSGDPETLNAIASLEKKDSEAAKELVETAKDTGAKITRKQVAEKTKEVKGRQPGAGQGTARGTEPKATATPVKQERTGGPAEPTTSGPVMREWGHADARQAPRVYVYWDGDDEHFTLLFGRMAKKGGTAFLYLKEAAESEDDVLVAFGSDEEEDIASFPLHGLRIERIAAVR